MAACITDQDFREKAVYFSNYWYMGTPRSLQLLNLKCIAELSISHKVALGRTGVYGIRRKDLHRPTCKLPKLP